jgi:hypothetical protein
MCTNGTNSKTKMQNIAVIGPSAVVCQHNMLRSRYNAGRGPGGLKIAGYALLPNRSITFGDRAQHQVTLGAPVTTPEPRTTVSRPRRPASSALPLIALLVLFALGAAAFFYLSRPQLIFTNQLAGPVKLVAGNAAPRTLAAGETVQLRLAGGTTAVVQWELVQPLSVAGKVMGEAVRGSGVVQQPRGTIRQTASPVAADADYFAPLITNAAEDQLRVVVNAGLEGALDCGCAVRAGAKRAYIGYYRLYQNSTVEARASDGRRAVFGDLGPRVTAPDRTLGLRFEGKDLRRP